MVNRQTWSTATVINLGLSYDKTAEFAQKSKVCADQVRASLGIMQIPCKYTWREAVVAPTVYMFNPGDPIGNSVAQTIYLPELDPLA